MTKGFARVSNTRKARESVRMRRNQLLRGGGWGGGYMLNKRAQRQGVRLAVCHYRQG